jgi:hypothetical protein
MLMMERKSKQREGTIARYKEGALITFNLDKIPGRDTPPEEAENPSSTDDEFSARGTMNGPTSSATVDMAASSPGTVRQGNAARPRPRPAVQPVAPVSPHSQASGEAGAAASAETQAIPRGESSASPVSDTVSHESP